MLRLESTRLLEWKVFLNHSKNIPDLKLWYFQQFIFLPSAQNWYSERLIYVTSPISSLYIKLEADIIFPLV